MNETEQIRKVRISRLMGDLLREAADKLEEAGKELRLCVNTTSDLNTMRGAALGVGPDVEEAAHLLLAATQGL